MFLLLYNNLHFNYVFFIILCVHTSFHAVEDAVLLCVCHTNLFLPCHTNLFLPGILSSG
jgi:hypothetical protein